MSEKNSQVKELKDKLFAKKKSGFLRMNESEIAECDAFCEDYKKFLDRAKTEREAAAVAVEMLKAKGYVEYVPGIKLNPGDKIYKNNRDKAVVMAIIGTEPIRSGVRLCAAHIDSPRLDLKQNPLYEDSEMALFKTDY